MELERVRTHKSTFVWFEGNISAGKTTLLNELMDVYPQAFVGLEDFDRSLAGLKYFYTADAKNCIKCAFFATQCGAVHEHLCAFFRALESGKDMAFFDRSIWGSMAFVDTARDNNIITSEEYAILCNLFYQIDLQIKFICEARMIKMIGILVDTPAETCQSRHTQRINLSEMGNQKTVGNTVDLIYLKQLHYSYWLLCHVGSQRGISFLAVDGLKEPFKLCQDVCDLLNKFI